MINKKTHIDEVIKLYSENQSSEITAQTLAIKYGLEYKASLGRKIRDWMSKEGLTKNNKINPDTSEIFTKAQKKLYNNSAKYYIVTSAQNATRIHSPFWKNIKAYADFLNAEIEVIPIRYRNPTSNFQDLPNDWWDDQLVDHLIANRHSLHKNLTVVADLKIQPTACTPLSGIEGLTKEDSCIIGHPRQHFLTVPTLDKQEDKFLLSTGSVTLENYTDSKSGKKGEFHHTFGFVIVEIKDDSTFYIRQVSANKNGSFYDLDRFVESGSVTQSQCVEAIVLGDLHLGKHDPYSVDQSYKMIDRFKPKNVILHDIMEGASISHHEKRDPFIALNRELDGSWDLEQEIKLSIDFLETIIDYHPVIVKSNHDDFVDRWLLDNDWRKEKNKYAYLKYSKLKADGELPKGILPYNIEQKFGKKVTCLTEDDSFKIKGIELAVHGHIGNGGSRGSAVQFKRLNTKLITGHTHSPLKLDNLTTVGTLTKKRMGYNKGLSSWASANALVHKNGKSQLILIFKDQGWTNI